MTVSPNSIVTPQGPGSAYVSQSFTANTTLTTTPSNTALLMTAGANGARVVKVRAIPIATVSATMLQLYRSSDAGTAKGFMGAVTAAAYTLAGATAPATSDFGVTDDNPILLTAGEQLYVAAGVTGSWCFHVEWGAY